MRRTFLPKDECHYILPDNILAQQRQHPLLTGLHICRAGNFPLFESFITQRPSGFSGSHILVYCTGGEGWFESAGQRWTISAGHVLFILEDVPHAYGGVPDNNWQIQWLHFSGEHAEYFLNLLHVTAQNPLIKIGAQFNLVRLFDEILQLCGLGYSPFILIQCAALLRQILSSIALQNSFVPPTESGLDVEQTVALMQECMARSLTVATLAEAANLSESHFSRLFQTKTGYAPLEYFIRLKMQKACERLITTDRAVQEIGRNLGYHDPYYFSRIFKKVVGLSPKQFRNQQQKSI